MAIALDHIRLDAADIDDAQAFYENALGLRRVVRYDVDDRIIVQMAPDGRPPGVELWQERGLAAAAPELNDFRGRGVAEAGGR